MAPHLDPSAITATTETGFRPFHPKRVIVSKTQHSHLGWGAVSLSLHPRKVPNPYGGPLIELQPEVVSTDGVQVLFLRRNSHVDIPNDYFVWSGQEGDLVCFRLPPADAEDFLAGSMGLLHYLVAHLSVMPDQNTGLITQATLHLCKYDTSLPKTAPWTYDTSSPKIAPWTSVTLPLPDPLPNLMNWHNHSVIALNGTDLMWVDLNKGILHMSFIDGNPSTSFKFFDLPNELYSISTKYWRNDRPEMFRYVGCCNGKVKLVNLHIPYVNTVAVDIWTLDLRNGNWSNDYKNVNLMCSNLWPIQGTLPPWPNSAPIFPFLREDNNSTILCLTVVEQKNKAWLLQIDMGTERLKDVTEYPCYYSHMKQPFLINSSSIMPKGTMILWPL